VTGFFRGLSNRKSFSALVCAYYHIYAAMEKALDEAGDESVRTMDFPQLRRSETLEADMAYFFGPSWQTQPASPATLAYCAHIQEMSKRDPYLLVAHQYTRYLGDLFGGQMMGGMAARSLQLEDGQGITFYRFEGIPNNSEFIENWYLRLNALPLSAEQKASIVDEGNLVFQLNIALLEELEGNGALTALKFALDSLGRYVKSKLFK
jgi:heme oxygenase